MDHGLLLISLAGCFFTMGGFIGYELGCHVTRQWLIEQRATGKLP